MAEPSNRIRELRIAAGLTQDELAKKLNPPTSGPQIQRLETGQRQLTTDWMVRLASAIGCHPADLMIVPPAPSIDARLATDRVSQQVMDSLSARGLLIYEVLTNVISGTGVERGDMLTVDRTLEEPKTGDIVLIELEEGGQLLLRVFVGGGLVTTNRAGRNDATRLADLGTNARIVGVAIGNGAS